MGNVRMVRHTKQLLQSYKVDVICFIETKTREASILLNTLNKLGYSESHIVELLDFTGGLLLVWNLVNVNVQIINDRF